MALPTTAHPSPLCAAAGFCTNATAARRCRGLTLIELSIVMVIVAIAASVALPSYRAQVQRSVRSEAQAYLMAAATRQQQFLLDTRAFAPDIATLGLATSDRVASAYDLNLQRGVDATPTFKLTAMPRAGQTGERCGSLWIDQLGAKGADAEGCW